MGAPTEYYVDPSIAGDSGSGTSGDPYGDVQYALNQITRDSTNGDKLNIKAGTDEVLTAALTLATYGTPTASAPLIFRGYTSAADDGGIGGISGNGSYGMLANYYDYVNWIDMHLHNSGSSILLKLGLACLVYNCELNDAGSNLIQGSNCHYSNILNCHFHNGSANAIYAYGQRMNVVGNYFKNDGTREFTYCVNYVYYSNVLRNIMSIDGSTIGILVDYTPRPAWIAHNSILSAGGTGIGIKVDMTDSVEQAVILNNLVEGFSGTGGIGIELNGSAANNLGVVGKNACYNNSTNYSPSDLNSGDILLKLGGNEALGSSPFAKSGSDTFANRYSYFEPNDVGSVRAGAWPVGARLDKGAVQHVDAGGGGTTVISRRQLRTNPASMTRKPPAIVSAETEAVLIPRTTRHFLPLRETVKRTRVVTLQPITTTTVCAPRRRAVTPRPPAIRRSRPVVKADAPPATGPVITMRRRASIQRQQVTPRRHSAFVRVDVPGDTYVLVSHPRKVR